MQKWLAVVDNPDNMEVPVANIHRLRAHILGDNPPAGRVTLTFPDGTVRSFALAGFGTYSHWVDEAVNDSSRPVSVRYMVRISRQPGVTFRWE